MPLLGVDASHHAFEVTSFALRVGYRHFVLDFQKMRTFGRSLFESQIPRKNVFLSTRIPKDMIGYRHSTRVLQKIQEEMPGGYADLCLVPGNAITLPAERAGTWHALEEAFDERICLSIGVSNYTVSHLDEMIHYARIEPSVNQIEFAPFMPVRELVEYCQDRNITVQAFGWMREEILTDLSVQKRAGEFRATPLTPSQFVTLCFLSQNIAPLFSPNKASELMEHAEVVELENNCFDWPYLPRPKQSHLPTPWIEAFVSGPKRGRRLLRSENDRNERNERNEKNQNEVILQLQDTSVDLRASGSLESKPFNFQASEVCNLPKPKLGMSMFARTGVFYDSGPKILTEDQRQVYFKDGYLILRNLLPKSTVEALRAELARLPSLGIHGPNNINMWISSNEFLDFLLFGPFGQIASELYEDKSYLIRAAHTLDATLETLYHADGGEGRIDVMHPANDTRNSRVKFFVSLYNDMPGPVLVGQSTLEATMQSWPEPVNHLALLSFRGSLLPYPRPHCGQCDQSSWFPAVPEEELDRLATKTVLNMGDVLVHATALLHRSPKMRKKTGLVTAAFARPGLAGRELPRNDKTCNWKRQNGSAIWRADEYPECLPRAFPFPHNLRGKHLQVGFPFCEYHRPAWPAAGLAKK